MKVILQKDVLNVGEAGDIKDVSDGFARNFLIPKKLVVLANASTSKAVEHQKRLIKMRKDKRKKECQNVLDSVNGLEITIKAKVGEEDKLFGSVTTMDIAAKLKEKGFTIDKRRIMLEEPIKHAGEFDVTLKLDEGFAAKIKVIVEKE